MVAIFRTILGLIVTVPVAVFCGLNIQDVAVTYSPFHDSIDLPLYAIALVAAFLGFLFGAFSAWLNGAPKRKERRSLNKRVKYLEKELSRLQKIAGDEESAVTAAEIEKASVVPDLK